MLSDELGEFCKVALLLEHLTPLGRLGELPVKVRRSSAVEDAAQIDGGDFVSNFFRFL